MLLNFLKITYKIYAAYKLFINLNIFEMLSSKASSHDQMSQSSIELEDQHQSHEQIENCPTLMKLSYAIENMENNNYGFNLSLMLGQVFLEVILISFFQLIYSQQLVGEFQNKILNLVLYKFYEETSQNSHLPYILIQLGIFILLVSIFLSLFWIGSEKIKYYTIEATTIFYYWSSLFLMVQVNFLFNSLAQLAIFDWINLLNAGNILLSIGLNILYKFLAHTYSISPSNLLCSRFEVIQIIASAISKIVVVVVFSTMAAHKYFINDLKVTQNILLACSAALFLIILLKLKNQFQSFTYADRLTEKIYRNCLALELSCILISLICLTSKVGLLIQNYFYVACCCYFFFYLLLDRLLSRRSRLYRLKTQDQIKTSSQAILFIRELINLFQIKYQKSATQAQLYMMKNLYKKHQDQCLEINCFCKGLNSHNKNTMEMLPFYRLLTLKIMEKLCGSRITQNSYEVLKMVLQIKLKIFNNFIGTSSLPQILRLEKLRKQFLFRAFLHKYNLKIQQVLFNKKTVLNFACIETIVDSDNLASKIIEKTQEVIKLKIQFWKNLAKGTINQIFQIKIEAELKLLKQMHSYTEIVVNNFQHNCFLVSLIINYQRNILLKEKISKELVNSLIKLEANESKSNLKFYQKKNDSSMIEKIMYSSLSCAIEISIDPEKLGMIVSISKNTKNIFRYDEKNLIGANINKIMPLKMQIQHDRLLKSWTQTCSWVNVGKLREVYCLDSSNICFAGKIYLKPIQRLNSVNVIGLFFKENDKDYLLIDDQNLVISAGLNFIQALGRKILNVPLKFICDQPALVQKWVQEGDRMEHSMNFYSTKSHSRIFNDYRQNASDPNIKQSLTDQIISLKNNQFQTLRLVFSVGKIGFGKLTFKYIKLCEIPDKVIKKVEKKPQNFSFTQAVASQVLIKQTQSSDEKQQNNFLAYNPSLNSSKEQQTVSTFNILNKLQKLFYSKEMIKDKRVAKVVLIISLLCSVSIITEICKIVINQKGYQQITQLLEASSTSSNNLQLTMQIFNKALTTTMKIQAYLQEYKASSSFNTNNPILSALSNQLDQLNYQQNNLHVLITEQVFKYEKSLTSLTKTLIFQYQTILVTWTDSSGEQAQIITIKFISNFLYFCGQISRIAATIIQKISTKTTDIHQLTDLSSKSTFYAQILKNNYLQLLKINKINLNYYQSLQISTMAVIRSYSYAKIAITMLALLIILLLLNFYYQFRVKQNYKISQIYQYISLDSVADLLEYFRKIKKLLHLYSQKQEKSNNRKIESAKIIVRIHDYQEQYSQAQQIRQKQSQKSSNLKLSIARISRLKTKVIFVSILIFSGILNLLIQRSQQEILNKSQEVVKIVDDFIASQNAIISPYLMRKSNKKIPQKELLYLVKNQEIVFTKMAISSLNFFKNFDEDFEQKMTKLLTQNVCELTKNDVPYQNYQKCLKDEEMKIIKFGVVNGINYFSRVFLEYLASQYANQISHKPATTTFTLVKVDKTLFQMLKVFQLMEEQIVGSLKLKIQNQKIQFLFYITTEITLFILFTIYAIKFNQYEKRKSADRVGRILLLPYRILKNQVKILQNFETAIDYFNLRS